jgi:hypothetical protein
MRAPLRQGRHARLTGARKAALDACAERWPHIYVQVVAKLAQIHRVEVGGPGDFQQAMNWEQLLEKVGERFGQQGRQMFERFVARLERLRADAERMMLCTLRTREHAAFRALLADTTVDTVAARAVSECQSVKNAHCVSHGNKGKDEVEVRDIVCEGYDKSDRSPYCRHQMNR